MSVKKLLTEFGFEAKLFTVFGAINGYDTIDSLMSSTDDGHDEEQFVYVLSFKEFTEMH